MLADKSLMSRQDPAAAPVSTTAGPRASRQMRGSPWMCHRTAPRIVRAGPL